MTIIMIIIVAIIMIAVIIIVSQFGPRQRPVLEGDSAREGARSATSMIIVCQILHDFV